MGRPSRPTNLKILAGDREDRINRNEPIPGDETAINPCVPLSEGAQKVWDRLAPDLIDKRVLTAWDVDMFAVFCDAVAVYQECCSLMGSAYVVAGSVKDTLVKSAYWRVMRDCVETMIRIGGKFGLTPADRAGIDTGGNAPVFGAERILD
jgi:P27 family predicted phage terminase small subunit